MDKTEKMQSDFIHTAPPDEARPVMLTNSHGCMHVKPQSVDEIINNGYLSRGSNIEIHPYASTLLVPNVEITNANPRKHFEVHFFPLSNPADRNISGRGELVVYYK